MKRFRCFVCGRPVMLKEVRAVFGLTCAGCFRMVEELPERAQKLFSFVFRRLEALERDAHGPAKARRRS